MKKLGYATNEAARRYLSGDISAAAARPVRKNARSSDEKRAKQATKFIESMRSYVINYNLGEDMVRSYIEKRGGTENQPEQRWREFEELLASPATAGRHTLGLTKNPGGLQQVRLPLHLPCRAFTSAGIQFAQALRVAFRRWIRI